jgi:hypothetical protein
MPADVSRICSSSSSSSAGSKLSNTKAREVQDTCQKLRKVSSKAPNYLHACCNASQSTSSCRMQGLGFSCGLACRGFRLTLRGFDQR